VDFESLLDPELVSHFTAARAADLSDDTIAQARQRFRDMAAAIPADDAVVRNERWIEAPGGHRVRVLIVRKRDAIGPAPGLLHFHPGATIMGMPETSLPLLQHTVRETGSVVVSVDYRLAPECPFPAALQDGELAWGWMTSHADELGIDPDRIGIMGESAGGGLAAGLAIKLRDRGEPSPRILALLYPQLDDQTAAKVPPPHLGHYGFSHQSLQYSWRAYLGSAEASAYAAPARATDLAGLPPTFVAVGAMDLFADEDIQFAARLVADGTPIDLHVYPGAPHGFDLVEEAQVTRTMRQSHSAALRRWLLPDKPPTA